MKSLDEVAYWVVGTLACRRLEFKALCSESDSCRRCGPDVGLTFGIYVIYVCRTKGFYARFSADKLFQSMTREKKALATAREPARRRLGAGVRSAVPGRMGRPEPDRRGRHELLDQPRAVILGCLKVCTEIGQTLQGSFSAVSKPNFASKYF